MNGPRSTNLQRAVRRSLCGLALTAFLALGLTVVPAGAAPAGVQDWPMFHRDISHTGVSTETLIGASDASGLNIQWQDGLGAPSYTSPAVVYNATLNKSVVYVGNNAGAVQAFDAATGNRIWWFKAGAAVLSSAAVVSGVVYFGSSDHKLYALNATTGQFICSYTSPGVVASSPLVADVGSGKMVFFGDNGLSGSDDGGDEIAINAVDPNAAADCGHVWTFTGFGDPPGSATLSGSWSPPALANDVNGRPILVFGGSSPDNSVYAVDARNGTRIWRFQTQVFAADQDVGAGPTLTAPGVNGFVDGVAYVTGKDAITYALNLRTGAEIWHYSIRAAYGSAAGSPRSTAAILGNRLYLGYGAGVLALNAVTGLKVWSSQDVNGRTNGIVSSPAVAGAAGDEIVFAGDFDGIMHGFSLATGLDLWTYNTGALIYSSPAVSAGKVFVTSSNGFLYAFGVGGGASAKPDTAISQPANGSTVPNPNGSLTISGSATDDVGVTQVLLAVKNKNTNKYWDAGSSTWTAAYTLNSTALGSPGATSSTWTFSVPIGTAGGVFVATAEAVDGDGQHDPVPAQSTFTVSSQGSPPDTTIVSPTPNQIFTFPGGVRQSFPITVSGTAVDTAGAHPGILKVKVIVLNIEHNEYFCGGPGCDGGGGSWTPFFSTVLATLASPGATSSNWTLTFPTYDHPHTYRITAWAIDNDQQADQTRARVSRICVTDPGSTC